MKKDKIIPDLLDNSTLQKEFSNLKGSSYLDHTGAALYAASQVEAVSQDLRENLFSNPHSKSLPSRLCGDTVDQVRFRVLQHFNTSTNDYSVIFTSGATEALKIVAESFDFTGQSSQLQNSTVFDNGSRPCGEFMYLQDNHTSVLGMRNVDNIVQKKVPCKCVTQAEAFQILSVPPSPRPGSGPEFHEVPTTQSNSLFVFPAQCNFSGLKYPLSWVQRVQDGALQEPARQSRCYCLLDAATYVSTNALDLSAIKPDFVVLSFYKMFGLPTGLGALIVRNSSASVLHKRYYGGGTVQVALTSRPTHVLKPVLHERFEDGTINFLSIIAVLHGLDWQLRVGLTMADISAHCFDLARYTYDRLRTLHHSNGCAAVCLYADTMYDDPTSQGGIVNFNMRRDTAQFVGYVEVLNLANLHGIHLRTGCFCNPGACQRLLGISEDQYYSNFEAGHVCGDDRDLIAGRPTGSVRVSFGPYSRMEDADRLLHMLTDCFVSSPPVYKEPENWKESVKVLQNKFRGLNKGEVEENDESDGTSADGTDAEHRRPCVSQLSRLCLYPVKSCGSMEVERWPLDHRGLLYDRCWMVVTDSGVVLTQTQEPHLCLVRPVLDLAQDTLHLTFTGEGASCSVPLDVARHGESDVSMCQSKVCGDNVRGTDCGPEVAEWLSRVLRREGLRLIRQSDSTQRVSKTKDQDGSPSALALSNQAQFLLVNENSVSWLSDKLPDFPKTNMLQRFRSNFVVQGNCAAFEEQNWKSVTIGSIVFKVEGPCGRCQMICIDQTTGEKTKEPLTTLAASCSGRIKFGIYLRRQSPAGAVVSVGDKVVPSIN